MLRGRFDRKGFTFTQRNMPVTPPRRMPNSTTPSPSPPNRLEVLVADEDVIAQPVCRTGQQRRSFVAYARSILFRSAL
jgi:hypothetical protein